MKLATADQVRELLKPGARKRKDADELGENLYYCWLTSMVQYLEKRHMRKTEKATSSQAEGTS